MSYGASAYGLVPFGGLPFGASDLSEESPVTQLLAGGVPELEVLMHLRPYDPVAEDYVDLYVSAGGFASGPGDTWPTGESLPHQYFLETLSRSPTIEGRFVADGQISTSSVPSYGEAVLADVARERSAWLGYRWEEAEFYRFLGSPDWPLSQFARTGRGDIIRLQPGSMVATLSLRSIVARLQRAIEPRTYLGLGACLDFAVDGRVTFGDVLDQTGSFTLQARVFPDITNNSTGRIWTKSDGTTGWLGFVNNLDIGWIIRGSGSLTASGVLTLDTWSDVFWTFDATTKRAAILVGGEGVPVEEVAFGTWTANPVATAHTLSLGAQPSGTVPFHGRIDEAAIWGKALTVAEARAVQGRELFGDETSLLGCWHLNEATGATVFDATANGNNGTIAGTALWIGSLTGTKELAGKQRLRGWGQLRGWSPGLVDEVDLVYEVLAQEVQSITNLRVKGASSSWTFDGYLANIYSTTPAAGHWTAAKDFAGNAYIRLGSEPDGEVVVDVLATLDTDAASIAQAIAVEAGLTILDDINEGAFAAIAATHPEVIGVGARHEPVSADALIVEALYSIQAGRTTDLEGRLTAYLLNLPEGPVAELTDDDLDLDACTRLHTLPAARSAVVEYRRNWTPQDPDSLVSSLSARERRELAQQFRSYQSPENAGVPASAKPVTITTAMDEEADAKALAERVAAYRAQPIHTDSIALLSDRYDLQEGMVITITAPVLDYAAGRTVLIVGASRDDGARRHVLEVLGP